MEGNRMARYDATFFESMTDEAELPENLLRQTAAFIGTCVQTLDAARLNKFSERLRNQVLTGNKILLDALECLKRIEGE